MSENYYVECSRCHRMVLISLHKAMDELARRTFTCPHCESVLKADPLTRV